MIGAMGSTAAILATLLRRLGLDRGAFVGVERRSAFTGAAALAVGDDTLEFLAFALFRAGRPGAGAWSVPRVCAGVGSPLERDGARPDLLEAFRVPLWAFWPAAFGASLLEAAFGPALVEADPAIFFSTGDFDVLAGEGLAADFALAFAGPAA